MFTKVQIYCKYKRSCFDDILKSKKPEIVINTDNIISLEEPTDWGYWDNYWKYPFRILNMVDDKGYLCVLESANELEKMLLELKGVHNNEKEEIRNDTSRTG